MRALLDENRRPARHAPAGGSLSPSSPITLRRAAHRVLRHNWTGSSTVPSRSLYPHQWSWDSAFIAIGLRHLAPSRARRELETLFAAQWGDGRVPHIVFAPQVPPGAYFPSPDFWRSSSSGAASGAPPAPETSGIVQPPVHALAALLVHQADPAGSARSRFLIRLYPRLVAWQQYLTTRRDLGGGGLASLLHPWESGMDNSPTWDKPLARITPAPRDTFRRADLVHGAPEDRPTDLDYGRYVALAARYRDGGYAAETSQPFAVEDPGFNTLLAVSAYALAEIAALLGRIADAAGHHAAGERLTSALLHRLWAPGDGLFLSRDLRAPLAADSPRVADRPGTAERPAPQRAGAPPAPGGAAPGGRLVPARGAAGLLPLLLPGLPPQVRNALLATLTGRAFGLGDRTRLVPSHDLEGAEFHPARYWRGPAWFNVNWLLERALRSQGESALADGVRGAFLRSAGASGFAEYLDPYTAAPHGARGFSWTAALTLDLLAAPAPAVPPRRGGRGPAGTRDQKHTERRDPAASGGTTPEGCGTATGGGGRTAGDDARRRAPRPAPLGRPDERTEEREGART